MPFSITGTTTKIKDREGNLYQVISHMSGKTYFLSYANGNITSVKDGAEKSIFPYDELNQLIRENNHILGKSIQYYYDHNGTRTKKVVDEVTT